MGFSSLGLEHLESTNEGRQYLQDVMIAVKAA